MSLTPNGFFERAKSASIAKHLSTAGTLLNPDFMCIWVILTGVNIFCREQMDSIKNIFKELST
jgi:hypothetical protein